MNVTYERQAAFIYCERWFKANVIRTITAS